MMVVNVYARSDTCVCVFSCVVVVLLVGFFIIVFMLVLMLLSRSRLMGSLSVLMMFVVLS